MVINIPKDFSKLELSNGPSSERAETGKISTAGSIWLSCAIRGSSADLSRSRSILFKTRLKGSSIWDRRGTNSYKSFCNLC